MKLFLHSRGGKNSLSEVYRRAFSKAEELCVVSAYLTDWDSELKLRPDCKHFRLIIGKDFGITRKKACEAVLAWIPKSLVANFRVADNISGFHPKAIFWKESPSSYYALVGSSNLSRAAFQSNFEANAMLKISSSDYMLARQWIAEIEKDAVPVTPGWLSEYQEGEPTKTTAATSKLEGPTLNLVLPSTVGTSILLKGRREQLQRYEKRKKGLISLFRKCAAGNITSMQFYNQLPKFWSTDKEIDNRFQAFGYEIRGKHSNFQVLARSYLRILDSDDQSRDDIVREEIDSLAELKIPTRAAFLSEMLCLAFPESYPVLNDPVRKYLSSIKFKAARGATEGAKYIDLASKLRASLVQNKGYPAKNLAELDIIMFKHFSRG